METTNEALSVPCDVVFIGASVPNLLAASALLERVDSIDIRILETPSHHSVSTQPFVTVISPEAWRALKELNGRLANLVHRRKLFLNGASLALEEKGSLDESGWMMLDQFQELLRTSLPDRVICKVAAIDQVHEMVDRVRIRLQDGVCYESKLLISDADASDFMMAPSGFDEVVITAAKGPLTEQREWKTSNMYINKAPISFHADVFSCVMPSEAISRRSILDELRKVPSLADVLTDVECTSVIQRSLTMGGLSSARGRTARSGEMSSSLPFVSAVKAEYEFEEVLHLKRAILNKGLTAAAISDWKRRQTASSTTQYLSHKKSPLDLVLTSEDATHELQKPCCRNADGIAGVPVESSALGKPLVCKDLKPYMALTLID